MPVEFTFDRFVPADEHRLTLQNTIITHSEVLQLTSVDAEEEVGRALYRDPIQLYDGFETAFNFRITASNNGRPAHGLAFVIETEIPPHKVVAVEFDTFSNNAVTKVPDPNYIHIGIRINGVNFAVRNWNWQDGEIATALVKYNAPSKTLSVRTSSPNNCTPDVLACHVDLTTCRSKNVKVGFSAATGQGYRQTTEVMSWSFKSYTDQEHNVTAIVV